jgi:hypothetical protein
LIRRRGTILQDVENRIRAFSEAIVAVLVLRTVRRHSPPPSKGATMRRLAMILVPIATGLAISLTAACHDEGPAERAGRKIDDAAHDAGDALKDVGENARDKMGDAGRTLGEKMEDAGEKMEGK